MQLYRLKSILFCPVDLSFFKLVVERQRQNSNKEEQDTAGDASDLMLGEEAEDLTLGTNVCTQFFFCQVA